MMTYTDTKSKHPDASQPVLLKHVTHIIQSGSTGSIRSVSICFDIFPISAFVFDALP